MDWFTSDTHAYHENIIKYCNRPFINAEEMTQKLANNINLKVSRKDTLWHLGDWAFGGLDKTIKFREMLNCQRVYLIVGNHDKHHLKHDIFLNLFERVYDVYEYRFSGVRQRMFLSHYAHRVWDKSHHGVWHLYGHSHGTLPDDPTSLSFDAGVDCHKFVPLCYQDIKLIMSRKTWKAVDHHGER